MFVVLLCDYRLCNIVNEGDLDSVKILAYRYFVTYKEPVHYVTTIKFDFA